MDHQQLWSFAIHLFQSVVPPCEVSEETDYHYEVWAVKKIDNTTEERHLIGWATRHENSVTIAFPSNLGVKKDEKIFPESLLKKMVHHKITLHNVLDQERSDLQNTIQNLMRYYTQMGWI